MDIIIPHRIKKKELGGEISDEARKIFEKLKEKSAIAVEINSPGLPDRTTLHKVYATTEGGALVYFSSVVTRLLPLCSMTSVGSFCSTAINLIASARPHQPEKSLPIAMSFFSEQKFRQSRKP